MAIPDRDDGLLDQAILELPASDDKVEQAGRTLPTVDERVEGSEDLGLAVRRVARPG